jgi:hypothetical protein
MTDSRSTVVAQLDVTSRWRRLLSTKSMAAVLVVLPAIFFYSILFSLAVNLPDRDDYWALLGFLNKMVTIQGKSAKASYFLAAQYNEYKLFFEHALVWLQLSLLGQVNFGFLCAIGSGFVLLLAILLWKMFLPGCDATIRLAYFIPVAWLVFQLQYVETLNWAMASLQNLPVLVFSLSTIYFLDQLTSSTYYAAMVCLFLGVASSGNGWLLVPIGIVMLRRTRCYWKIAGFLIITAGCIAAYAYHYTIFMATGPIHFSVSSVLIGLPFYFVTFLGSAAAFPLRGDHIGFGILLCPLLGLAICTFFVVVRRRGYFRRNPLVGYCVLFLLTSAGMVTLGRSGGGIISAYSSRYGIYSALLLIFAWFAIVQEFLLLKNDASRRALVANVIKIIIMFSLTMDFLGWQYGVDRNQELIQGMTAFERCSSSATCAGPVLPVSHPHAWFLVLEQQAPAILRQSIRLGIYKPPEL